MDATITHVSLPTANTEVTHTLTGNPTTLIIRLQGVNAILRVSYIAGGTGATSDNYVTIEAGAAFLRPNLEFNARDIYLRTDKQNKTAEVEEYV